VCGGIVGEDRRQPDISRTRIGFGQSAWSAPPLIKAQEETQKPQTSDPLQRIYTVVRDGLRTARGKAFFTTKARLFGYTEESANLNSLEKVEYLGDIVYSDRDERKDEAEKFREFSKPTKSFAEYLFKQSGSDPKYFDKLLSYLNDRGVPRTARNAAVERKRWDVAKKISEELGEMSWLLDAADHRGEFGIAQGIAAAMGLSREVLIYEAAQEFLKPNNREAILKLSAKLSDKILGEEIKEAAAQS